MSHLISKINLNEIASIQKRQYPDKLLLSGIIPASSSLLLKVHVTGGAFLSKKITGQYETLFSYEITQDDGICHLRGLLRDEGMNRNLFSDYIPLSLFLTPGRMKSSKSNGVYTDPPTSQVFWPDNFEYFWEDNTDISIDIKNDSNIELKTDICFHGIRIWNRG